MSKKKQGESKAAPAPVISKIPLPISDSPLVIDLPDGQKLVVGKMIQGSVIEVATWRGTGRPDSRTSRLMLGMSIGDVNPAPDEKADQIGDQAAQGAKIQVADAPEVAKSQIAAWIDYLSAKYPSLKFLKRVKPHLAGKKSEPGSLKGKGFAGAARRGAAKARPINSAPPSDSPAPATNSSESEDIAAWLDQISEKARVRVEAKSEEVAPQVKSARKNSANSNKADISLDDVFTKAPRASKPRNTAKKSASAPKKRK